MWVTRTVVLASLLMIFIPYSASKPQGDIESISPCIIDIPVDDDEFLNQLLGAGAVQESATCICVPRQSCCDEGNDASCATVLDESFVTLKQNNPIVDVQEHNNSKCGDILQVCCDNECPQNPNPTPGPVTPTTPNQCGIRHNNGIGLTVNGFEDRQAQLNEFPWMVAVLDKDDEFIAGGSLVHRRVVLTAGHKVYNLNASNLVARMGDWDISSTSEPIPHQSINVVKIVFHENFQRPTMVNNVALLILESDATLSDTVMPICMPKSGQTFDGTDCIVTGWGKDMFGKTGRYQTIMKKLSVPAVGHRDCQDKLRKTRLGSTFELHESFNCAGGQKEDPCTGDGGSPLVCPNPENPNEYVQMGVVSWGIGCGIVGNPGVYGSIPKTEDWILRTIQAEVGIGFDERVG